MDKVEFKVEGMDCGGCVKSVTRMLTGVAGVSSVAVRRGRRLRRQF